MVSSIGRLVLLFYIEIFNHLKIRELLLEAGRSIGQRIKWRGHSDTATLVAITVIFLGSSYESL